MRHPTRTAGRTAVDRTSLAHVRAKYFSPVHPWCVVDLGAHHDLWCDDGGWLGEWISMAHVGAKYFSPVQPWYEGKLGRAPRFMAWRCLMVGRLRTDGASPGEKCFAPTSMVRRRTAGARSKRVGDCASIARAWAKYFSPVQMRRVVKFGVRHDLGHVDV